MKQRLLLGAAALPLLAGLSAAQQFTTLAADSFDYPAGMDLGGLSGGQGFLVPWYAGQAGMDATITAPGFDAVGNKATTVPQMVGPFEIKAENYRRLDLTGFDLITDPDDGPSGAVFGKDGAIIWVTFVMQRIPGGDDTFGGLSLFTHFGSNGGEKLFMGSPFQFFDLGIDDQAGCVFTVPGTSVDQLTRLVYRLDFLPGDERVRMWVDPMVDHPVTAPDLDVTVPDFRFNEIRIGSGDGGTVGSMGGYEFDDIRIECQDCLPPPVQNFTGNPAQISVVNGGSQALALDATPSGRPDFVVSQFHGDNIAMSWYLVVKEGVAMPAPAEAGSTTTYKLTPLKNGGDHSFGSRFRPLRNRPPVFWCHFLEFWCRDGENSEKTEKKRAKMGEIWPNKKSACRRPICDG